MPLTIGEVLAGGSLGAAFLAISGWIKNISGRSCELDSRLKALEDTVTEKSSKIDVHESNLVQGARQMEGMKAELTTLNKNLVDLHRQGYETASIMEKAVLRLEPQIKALGEKVRTDVNEIFLKLDPRLKSVEKQIENLEDDCSKK